MDCIVHGVTKSWTRLSYFHKNNLLTVNAGTPSVKRSRRELFSLVARALVYFLSVPCPRGFSLCQTPLYPVLMCTAMSLPLFQDFNGNH